MEKHRILPSILLSWSLLLLVQTDEDLLDGSCRILGVFHIGINNRYNMSLEAAHANCRSLGVKLATQAQVEAANLAGFQVCRFGWVDDGYPVISRVTPMINCGNNQTGVIKMMDINRLYDGFCISIKDAHKVNACEPLLQITATGISMIETASPTLLDLTHAETVSVKPSETSPQLETETHGLPGANTELPISSANPSTSATKPLISTTTSLISTTELFLAVMNNKTNRLVVIVLTVLAAILIIVTVVIIVCHLTRKRWNTFDFEAVPPKEIVEIEEWNHNLVDNGND
ncbi:lymphatic vessel endothelial hyaluronic acid receptor 1a [Callorhinchus milii]|uniref:CD44 antigen n=1 Tax=Callorhinchus milii TaxID=7868 RepID=A0A4W3K5D9_CALMI|nr:lymphatic vessel endothelial hyaluronic acid receptor 1a [Callorhinchus milii]|eukprot:gi/632981323/ref/XP_007907529.1/ PREDICTED: lymphatic vessel endothelial hyaluronic acid receptor 1 [Callorhinchus milii]